jgi:hypothetical protein
MPEGGGEKPLTGCNRESSGFDREWSMVDIVSRPCGDDTVVSPSTHRRE